MGNLVTMETRQLFARKRKLRNFFRIVHQCVGTESLVTMEMRQIFVCKRKLHNFFRILYRHVATGILLPWQLGKFLLTKERPITFFDFYPGTLPQAVLLPWKLAVGSLLRYASMLTAGSLSCVYYHFGRTPSKWFLIGLRIVRPSEITASKQSLRIVRWVRLSPPAWLHQVRLSPPHSSAIYFSYKLGVRHAKDIVHVRHVHFRLKSFL